MENLAPGAPVERAERRRRPRLILVAAVAGVLWVAANAIPIPIFFIYLPGPVTDVENLIEVDGSRTYSSEGSLYFTTVSIDTKVTGRDLIASMFDPQKRLVMRDQVTGGASLEESIKEQQRAMELSKLHAKEVALGALGLGRPSGNGARVVATVPGSPAHGLLVRGDVIKRLNGREVMTTCDVTRALDDVDPGDRVAMILKRDRSNKRIEIQSTKNPRDESSAFLGVQMEDVGFSFEPAATVDFDTGEVAGPSAGLMFSLGLYDKLTPDDLTSGRKVAGTGTIECDGDIGPIGGIEQKVAGAEAQGMDVFLAPAAEAREAERVAGEIEVVPVRDFMDAVDYLESAG